MIFTECVVSEVYQCRLTNAFAQRIVSSFACFFLVTILCHARPSFVHLYQQRNSIESAEASSVQENALRESENSRATSANEDPVNAPPIITGQTPDPIAATEDESFTIELSNLLVTDIDSNYPTGFSLQIFAGDHYSISGNTILPEPNFAGELTVPVTVNDGTSSSNTFLVKVNVAAVNDQPVIISQNPNPLTGTEDVSFTLSISQLQITDPDDTYPGDFTLEILDGPNYTYSGTTVTPGADFFGPLVVHVTVNDGSVSSDPFDVHVEISSVNDPPIITGQTPNPWTIQEDTPATIEVNNLVINDPDDSYPNGFTLQLSPGNNYSITGNTVTPAANFSGTLSVPVLVNDGDVNSNTFNISITVNNTNDKPVITGQKALTVEEDNSIQILLNDLVVSDPDGDYPNGYTLKADAGNNYIASGNTITPTPNYSGSLSVPVQVNDGAIDSEPFALQITVNPINDPPVITGQNTITTQENQPVTIALGDLVVSDPDDAYPGSFTMIISPGANYTSNGSTVTPATGFNGVLSVGIKVNDGDVFSNEFMAHVTVNPVNDPPVITGQKQLSTVEDTGITVLTSDLTVTDSDNTYPAGFTIKISPGENYTTSGTTITPNANYTGVLSVATVVNDGTNDSAPFNLQITVTPVNDSPVIIAQQPLSINEDQPLTIEFAHLTVSDPDNGYPNGFSLTVSSGANYTAVGNVVTPEKDFSGTLTIPVQVSDGTLTSNVFSLQVVVNAVNDPPVITGQQPLATPEDIPIVLLPTHLVVTDPDNTYPIGFTLQIAPGEHYSVLGNVITPSQDFSGTLNITVTVNDGIDLSAPFILQIQVGDSNDPPVITGQVALTINEEETLTLLLSHLIVSDPDNPYPQGFSLLISQGTNYTTSGDAITPSANFSGTLSVPVRVNDGVNNSPMFDLKIQVNAINDAPYFDPIGDQKILENSSTTKLSITNISKGPNENDQQITFVATSSNTSIVPNPSVDYAGTTNSATLSFAPAPNISGTVTITLLAIDNGATGPPNQNSFSRAFLLQVDEINAAPTLDPIVDKTVLEDAAQLAVDLTGISAGPGENQNLTVEVFADKADLFEVLSITYTSPQATGRLDAKPKANANGAAKITVKVTDNGSATPPSINNFYRTFLFTIQSVNDPPLFVSKPVALAIVNEPYEYIAEISDVETNNLAVSAVSIPGWATLTSIGNGKAKLSGVAPPTAAGTSTITLQVNDAGLIVQQQFNLVVNNRPTVTSFAVSMLEDVSYRFSGAEFSTAYSDINQQPITKILVTRLPRNGKLFRDELELKLSDTIDFASVASITYKPNLNYFGTDIIGWKASDPYSYSLNPAEININIQAVNDPPSFDFETDSLQFEVNGEPKALTEIFQVQDPDDDSLAQAEVGFRSQNFRLDLDVLTFENSLNVKGNYDYINGKILFSGHAPVVEYDQVIRSVRYNHLNTLDPQLESKYVYVKLNDGHVWGEPKDRVVELRYTFIELEIPTGFTPNGDGANDMWVITRPGGLDKLGNAVIRVFNRRGVEVFKKEGFDRMWDGTMNGETLPADTYFYTIDLSLRNKKTYKGVVTILR